jgi:hypothetical protein
MDWLDVAKTLALVVGAVLGVAALLSAAMVWFLNHPKD